MIDARVASLGTVINGWLIPSAVGVFVTDYLFRAAIAQFGLGGNIAQAYAQAFYPVTFTDGEDHSMALTTIQFTLTQGKLHQ